MEDKGFRFPVVLSPYHWIHIIAAKLSRWVSRLTLAVVFFFELLGHVLFAFVFLYFKQIGALGLLFTSWHWWFAFSIIRGLVCLFGIVSICRRKVDVVRVYFFLYIVNACFGIFVLTPIFRTSCSCDRFLQCYALRAFEAQEPLVNPFVAPNKKWADLLNTPMRYSPPPDKGALIDKMTALTISLFTAQSKPHSLLELDEEHRGTTHEESELNDVAASIARESSSGDTRSDIAASMEDETDDHPFAQSLLDLDAVAPDGSDDSGTLRSALRIRSWWRTFSVRAETVDDLGMLGMYYVSPKRFRWVVTKDADKDMHCSPSVLAPLKAWVMSSLFDDLRNSENFGKTAKLDIGMKMVQNHVEGCFGDRRCYVVTATIDWSLDFPKLYICRLMGAVELRLAPSFMETRLTPTIEFVKEDTLLSGDTSGRHTIYRVNVETLSSYDGMKMIQTVFSQECLCDVTRSGCKAGTEDGKSYWCWVNNASVSTCVDHGYKVYLSHTRSAYWTEDLCNPPVTTCACTHLGMYPREQYQMPERIKKHTLWPNQLNFGAHCEKWSEKDTLQWCYVGFDSNCPDKFGRDTGSEYTNELNGEFSGAKMPLQFKSSMPCNAESQEHAYMLAMRKCEIFVVVLIVVFIVEFLISIPVAFMLHKYLSQRCSDTVVVEDQFGVTFSDDDDDNVQADGRRPD